MTVSDSQSCGKVRISPKPVRIAPEIYAQNEGGIVINAVDTLSRKVKTKIETAKEPMTIKGVSLLRAPALVPSTTGKSGKMHGAKTVKAPATKDSVRKVIGR